MSNSGANFESLLPPSVLNGGLVNAKQFATAGVVNMSNLIEAMEKERKGAYFPENMTMNSQVLLNKVNSSSPSTFQYSFYGIGGTRVQVKLPVMESGQFAFRINENSEGEKINEALYNHPDVRFENIEFVGSGSADGGSVASAYNRTFRIVNCQLKSLANGFVNKGFSDLTYIDSLTGDNTVTGWGWQGENGDGQWLRNVQIYGGKSVLAKHGSGTISGFVSGVFQLVVGKWILQDDHQEGDGPNVAGGKAQNALIKLEGGDYQAKSLRLYTLTNPSRPAIEVNDEGAAERFTLLALENTRFMQRLDKPGAVGEAEPIGNLQGIALKLQGLSTKSVIRFIDTHAEVFQQTSEESRFDERSVIGFKVSASETGLQEQFTNRRVMISSTDCQVRYNVSTSSWEVRPVGSNNDSVTTRRFATPALNLSKFAAGSAEAKAAPTTRTAGEHYYTLWAIDDRSRRTNLATEKHVTLVEGEVPVISIVTGYPCRVVLEHGTTAGTFTEYTEHILPFGQAVLADMGSAIGGQAWSSSGLPSRPTTSTAENNTAAGRVLLDSAGISESYGTALLTTGEWQKINDTFTIAGIRYVCTANPVSNNGGIFSAQSALPSSVENSNSILTEPTVYVSKLGNDTNSGLGPAQAFLTVHKAIEYLKGLSGGTGAIYIGSGIFVEKPLTRPSGCSIFGKGPYLAGAGGTRIEQESGGNGNTLADEAWGTAGVVGAGGVISDIEIHGNKANQTLKQTETLTSSSGVVITNGTEVELPVLNLTSQGLTNANFTENGSIWVGSTLCTYTGKTSTAFTGVKSVYASSFTTTSELVVVPFASLGNGLAIQSNRVTVRNVKCTNCIGSARKYQASGTSANAQFPFQNASDRCEDYNSERYGLEIYAAPDGISSNWISGSNAKGQLFAGGNDWIITNGHAIGNTSVAGTLAPQAIRVCANKVQLFGFYLDRPPYEAVKLDMVAFGQSCSDFSYNGEVFNPSSASSGAGASAVLLYGASATLSSVAQRMLVKATTLGRGQAPIINGPRTFLVGVQNLAAPTGGKVQILSALSLSPTSALGGNLTVAGSGTLEYTGSTSFGAATAESASIGQASLKLSSASAGSISLATSGILTIYPASSSEAAVLAMRVTYTGLTGTTITGIPTTGSGSITETLATETGVAQHFLTGVAGGTGSAVADGTEITQLARAAHEATGQVEVLSSQSTDATLIAGRPTTTIRVSGQVNNKPNPFRGKIEIAIGNSEGSVEHRLGAEPAAGEYFVTPAGKLQVATTSISEIVASSTKITVKLSTVAATQAAIFNVYASSSPA